MCGELCLAWGSGTWVNGQVLGEGAWVVGQEAKNIVWPLWSVSVFSCHGPTPPSSAICTKRSHLHVTSKMVRNSEESLVLLMAASVLVFAPDIGGSWKQWGSCFWLFLKPATKPETKPLHSLLMPEGSKGDKVSLLGLAQGGTVFFLQVARDSHWNQGRGFLTLC